MNLLYQARLTPTRGVASLLVIDRRALHPDDRAPRRRAEWPVQDLVPAAGDPLRLDDHSLDFRAPPDLAWLDR
jgi:hypothetical protein